MQRHGSSAAEGGPRVLTSSRRVRTVAIISFGVVLVVTLGAFQMYPLWGIDMIQELGYPEIAGGSHPVGMGAVRFLRWSRIESSPRFAWWARVGEAIVVACDVDGSAGLEKSWPGVLSTTSKVDSRALVFFVQRPRSDHSQLVGTGYYIPLQQIDPSAAEVRLAKSYMGLD